MKHLLIFGLHLGGVAVLAILYHQAAPTPKTSVSVSAPLAAVAAASASTFTPTAESAEPTRTAPDSPLSPVPLADGITRALRSGSAHDRDHALHVLLPRLIAHDPVAAGQLALNWEPGALREEFLRQFIHHWSQADIGAALSWLITLVDAQDRSLAAATSTAQVRQGDPAGALELSQVLRVGLDDGSFEHLAQLWTEDDPRAAVDWVLTQPAGPMRDRLLARIAWVRAQSEPAEAAGLVLNHMSPGEAQNAAVGAVVLQWARRAPDEAAEWVGHFTPGPLHTRALAEIEIARRMSGGK